MIDLTSKLGEINNIQHNKGCKVFPQNQVISDCIMSTIPLVFKYHSDMGHCFSYVVVVSKKSKKKKKKKIFFFFTFLNWKKKTWYWRKRWLFSIGNGDEIRPVENGRKCPVRLLLSFSAVQPIPQPLQQGSL